MQIYINSELEDLIPEYLKTMDETIVLLKKLLKSQNYEEIIREGHKMKGHGKGYGFDFISEIGEKIESKGREKDLYEVKFLTNELEEYMKKIEIIFN